MRKRGLFLLLVVISLITLSVSSVPVAQSQAPEPMLRVVTIDAESPAAVKKLARMGLDIAAVRKGPVVEDKRGFPVQTYRVEAVISAHDEKKLGHEGFHWSEVQARRLAMATTQYSVYHSFDEPVYGIKAQLFKIAATHRRIARLWPIGFSIQHRPILAMQLTNFRARCGKGFCHEKPRVLFLATHHAREWVATEMAMRLIKYLTSNYGSDPRVTNLLDTVEVWVIPVANPDGYEYTFTTERLWRKNLRDNDGDGQITLADGVDLNRNFPAHWGYDDEGSSPNWSDQTYRGTAPNSEPETQAVVRLVK